MRSRTRPRRLFGMAVITALSGSAAVLGPPGSAAWPTPTPDVGTTETISIDAGVTTDGQQPSLSRDGDVVTYLRWRTEDGYRSEVVVVDRRTQTRVVLGAPGSSAYNAVVTADGRSVFYVEEGLDSADVPLSRPRLRRYRLATGRNTRVPLPDLGGAETWSISAVSPSATGRSVAYSLAWWPVDGERPVNDDIFVTDARARTTVSLGVGGSDLEGDIQTGLVSLSGDASTVAFTTQAPLVPGDDNDTYDSYVLDLPSGAPELVSAGPTGRSGDARVGPTLLSLDGQVVVFSTSASDLGPATPPGVTLTYRYDRSSGVTTLASRNPDGAPVGADVRGVSATGRFLLLEGAAGDYGFAPNPSDPSGLQLYLYDARKDTVTLVTRARGQDYSSRVGVEYADAALAANGRRAAYTSTARDTSSTRPAVDEYNTADVFVWSR